MINGRHPSWPKIKRQFFVRHGNTVDAHLDIMAAIMALSKLKSKGVVCSLKVCEATGPSGSEITTVVVVGEDDPDPMYEQYEREKRDLYEGRRSW